MMCEGIFFSKQQLNRLFPHHLLVDEHMTIQSVGADLQKEFQTPVGGLLQDSFTLGQAVAAPLSAAMLASLNGQSITLYATAEQGKNFSGTIEAFADGKKFLIALAATEKRQDAVQLLEEEKYRRIIANMNLSLIEIDLNLRIQYVNENFCLLSGFAKEEVLGQLVTDIFPQFQQENIFTTTKEKRKQGIPESVELVVKNKRGEECCFLISAGPLYNTNGELKGSISIQLDITTQKKLEQQTLWAQQEADRSARSKETFLANMSHEIRTPMNAIAGMGEQLQKTALTNHQQLYVSAINTSVSNLLVIINDILDFSKIEAGKVKIENIGFDLRKLVQHALHVITHQAEEKGLQLTSYIDARVARYLLGDPYRINQILINLLSNAVKFTARGKVTVNVGLLSHGAYYQKVQLRIHDTGIGMSAAFMSQLFDAFKQEHNSTERQYGGTGLGMSITKQLVELMGGNISIESTPDAGTTVTVSLELMQATESDLPKQQKSIADFSKLAGKRILLVEDNAMNRLLADVILNQYNVALTETTNGQEALQQLKKNEFDLVLMDVQMPVMDGLEATKKIRQELGLNLPVIALTANAIKGELDKCIEAGMNDFITKPFPEEELLRKICQWIERTASADKAGAVPQRSTPLYNLSKLRNISHGNEEFVQRMLDIFLAEVPPSVEKIMDAYPEGHFETISSLAHRLRPSIHAIGVDSLNEDVARIEHLADLHQPDPELYSLIHKMESVLKVVVAQLEANERNKGQMVA